MGAATVAPPGQLHAAADAAAAGLPVVAGGALSRRRRGMPRPRAPRERVYRCDFPGCTQVCRKKVW